MARGTWYETITTQQVIKLLYLMAMAMPQRPVGLDMKLSQANMGLNYPLVISHVVRAIFC